LGTNLFAATSVARSTSAVAGSYRAAPETRWLEARLPRPERRGPNAAARLPTTDGRIVSEIAGSKYCNPPILL